MTSQLNTGRAILRSGRQATKGKMASLMGCPRGWDSWARRSPASTTVQEREEVGRPGELLERSSKRRVRHDDRGEEAGVSESGGRPWGPEPVDADFFVFASSSWPQVLQADTCTGV